MFYFFFFAYSGGETNGYSTSAEARAGKIWHPQQCEIGAMSPRR